MVWRQSVHPSCRLVGCLGGGDVPVGVGLVIHTAGNRAQPPEFIIAVGQGIPGGDGVGVQASVLGGIVGEALSVGFVANLPGLGHQTAHIVIALPCPKHRCAVILPLAVDQTAQGIVVVEIFRLVLILNRGNAVQLPVAGVGVGQGQAVGVGDGLGTAQNIVAISRAEAVATILLWLPQI